MKKPIQIGNIKFSSKKEALNHFNTILNSYNFGDILNDIDFKGIMELVKEHPNPDRKIGAGIEKVRIAKLRFNTKSFELMRVDESSTYLSYTKRINKLKTKRTKFSKVCRSTIQNDLRQVKLEYFKKHSKKGKVKCQETNELLSWEELTVDHRQPNTFSVIVDRFIEVNNIDVETIKYIREKGQPDKFQNERIVDEFRSYHSQLANLRIVNKNLNLGRSNQARIKRQKKDLTINIKRNE